MCQNWISNCIMHLKNWIKRKVFDSHNNGIGNRSNKFQWLSIAVLDKGPLFCQVHAKSLVTLEEWDKVISGNYFKYDWSGLEMSISITIIVFFFSFYEQLFKAVKISVYLWVVLLLFSSFSFYLFFETIFPVHLQLKTSESDYWLFEMWKLVCLIIYK